MDPARAAVRRVTPAIDRRQPAVVGRHARLELVFACRAGRTVLADAYAEPPFHIGRCFPDGAGLHMILASSAPGVFGGDHLRQTVRVQQGAHVRLTSQSALQAHPTPNGAGAILRSTYQVDEDASLQCHWDPVIPFAGARLEQTIDIDLAESASLFWSDAFMSGRHARGERWRFAMLAHELRLLRAGSLEYLERYCIAPDGREIARRWVAADASYFGTAVASGRAARAACAGRIHAEFAGIDGLRAAADELDRELLVIRLMASDAIAFHRARTHVRDILSGRRFDAALSVATL